MDRKAYPFSIHLFSKGMDADGAGITVGHSTDRRWLCFLSQQRQLRKYGIERTAFPQIASLGMSGIS